MGRNPLLLRDTILRFQSSIPYSCVVYYYSIKRKLHIYSLSFKRLAGSLEGGDHVTMTGHARAGMGHRKWVSFVYYKGLL